MIAGLMMLALMGVDQLPAAPELPKPKLICREPEEQLGSHIRIGRRCKTAEEWQDEDARRYHRPPTLEVVPSQSEVPTTQSPQLP